MAGPIHRYISTNKPFDASRTFLSRWSSSLIVCFIKGFTDITFDPNKLKNKQTPMAEW